MKTLLATGCMLLALAVTAGGGWPKKKGKGYYKLSEWWIVADQHFEGNGELADNVTTGIFNTTFYAEYGLTDRVTGILYLPFFSRTYRNDIVSATTGNVAEPGEAINALGDANIGFKYGISKPGSQFAFAGSLTFGLPIGEEAGGSDGSLQTGDGEFNQLIQFDLSKSFSSQIYGSIYAGFNNRTESFSDEVRFGAEAGLAFGENKFWLIGRLDVVESLKNSPMAFGGEGSSIFSNNTEFVGVGLEGAYYLSDKIGVTAGVGGAIRGEVILARPSYSIGVFLDIK